MHAIRSIGVDVEDAFQILLLDKLRKLPCPRRGNLAGTLAQLWWDESKSEPPIDRRLGPAGADCASCADAIDRQDQLFISGKRLQLLQMLGAPSRIEQRGALLLRWGDVNTDRTQPFMRD